MLLIISESGLRVEERGQQTYNNRLTSVTLLIVQKKQLNL